MPYCPECGNKVSITDKRCSKCGYKLLPIDLREEDIKKSIKRPSIDRSHHNIEFALAIISVVLSVFAISQSFYDYSYMNQTFSVVILMFVFIGVVGAIITRYYAKPGSVIVLITGFLLVLVGVQDMLLSIIFAVITAIVAFVLN